MLRGNKQNREGDDEYLKAIAGEMWTKFEKYWSEFNATLAITVVLDHLYKLNAIDFSYKKIYRKDSLEFFHVKKELESLFEEYKSKANQRQQTSTHSQKKNDTTMSEKIDGNDATIEIFKVKFHSYIIL